MVKLYGFRPKSDEERELVERAMDEGNFPSIDAFVREAVLAYISPNLGPAAASLMDAYAELERGVKELRERMAAS